MRTSYSTDNDDGWTVCDDSDGQWALHVRLDLRRHCIETAVKHLHERCMKAFFKQPRRRQMIERQLTGLEHARQALDFGRLRSQYPALAGGLTAEVGLTLFQKRPPTLSIDGKLIDLELP